MSAFPKDKWIKSAIARKYLIVFKDGTIRRARKADAKGNVDFSKGYTTVKPQTHKKSGRVYFNMTFGGYTKSVLCNRVVALRFLPNPNNLPQVNHIDGDKQNNALENPDGSMQLEWCTGAENERHAHKEGLKTGRGSSNSNAKLSAQEVINIRQSDLGVLELSEKFGVTRSTISNIINRRTWKHV